MRISNFGIDNFRNIIRANGEFGNINIFTGRNSSGKSNFLLALSKSLKIDRDFSTDFFDNVVTYGRGKSKATFRTTITDLNRTTLYQSGKSEFYFRPESYIFENQLGKKTSSPILHKLLYKGEFSSRTSTTGAGVHDDFTGMVDFFKKSPTYIDHKEPFLVYEKDFSNDTEVPEMDQILKKIETKNIENQQMYFEIFSEFKNSIVSWIDPRMFSSAIIHKFVTERPETEVYDQVLNRLKETGVGSSGNVSFSKARFIFLLADVQKNKKQREQFYKDLSLYTQNVVSAVEINTDGSQGNKGEIWVTSPNAPKDIVYISAGTAVMIYFVLLKNWIQLPFNAKSYQKPEVMIFDEVDAIIHPLLMKNFSEILRAVSKNVQLFISTHSPHFIDCFEKKEVFWLKDFTSEKNQPNNHSNIFSYEEIIKKVQNDSEYLRNRPNSELFIEGLMDTLFPMI